MLDIKRKGHNPPKGTKEDRQSLSNTDNNEKQKGWPLSSSKQLVRLSATPPTYHHGKGGWVQNSVPRQKLQKTIV